MGLGVLASQLLMEAALAGLKEAAPIAKSVSGDATDKSSVGAEHGQKDEKQTDVSERLQQKSRLWWREKTSNMESCRGTDMSW